MSYKGELQTLSKLSMRHQVCPNETCRAIISESILTMLMSRGRSNCGVKYYVSVSCKVREYLPCEWILYDCIKDKVYPNQFGGIKGSSTTLALIHLVNYVCSCSIVWFFKSIWSCRSSTSVAEAIWSRCSPFLVKWAASFLLNRMQQVKIGSHLSTLVLQNARCTQCTPFGPLAFCCPY